MYIVQRMCEFYFLVSWPSYPIVGWAFNPPPDYIFLLFHMSIVNTPRFASVYVIKRQKIAPIASANSSTTELSVCKASHRRCSRPDQLIGIFQ